MARLLRLFQSCFGQQERRRRNIQSALANTDLTHHDVQLEEETLPTYRRQDFFPIVNGMVLKDRYKVLGKLGYGSSSTVWFCWDRQQKRYVAVKVCIVHLAADGKDLRSKCEWEAYSCLAGLESKHEGASCVRQLLNRFTISASTSSAGAQHQCFVYAVACMTLGDLEARPGPLKVEFRKEVLKEILRGLDFLHTEAHFVHTDLKADNVFFNVGDKKMLDLFAGRLSRQRPVGRHDTEDHRIIYKSIRFTDLLNVEEITLGSAVLGDLGEARIVHPRGTKLRPCLVGSKRVRAPETLLSLPWDYGVDIWAFASLAWSLAQRQRLFDARDENGVWSSTEHLWQMVDLMGAPPADLLRQSPTEWRQWRIELAPEEKIDGQALALSLDGRVGCPEDFLLSQDFMRSMLQWKPQDRATAGELMHHPYLNVRKAWYTE